MRGCRNSQSCCETEALAESDGDSPWLALSTKCGGALQKGGGDGSRWTEQKEGESACGKMK